jgi:uncharacterized protein YrrD
MTTRSAVVQQSELINQLVLDRNTMEELGRVEVLWMYPQQHQVLGIVCKTGFLGTQKLAFRLAQLDAIGANGILTTATPEATDAGKVKQLQSLLHHEIWSDTGNKIGNITDYLFNTQTGTITQYLFVSNGWSGVIGEVYQLSPSQILSLGRKRVLVTEAVAQTLQIYRPGIQQTLTKRAEAVTEQAKGQLQTLTEQARERTRSLSQQAKNRMQSFNDQLKENTQTLAERTRERSQNLAEQVREQTQILGEQVEEGIQTLTVHAREILDPVVESSLPSPDISPEGSDQTEATQRSDSLNSTDSPDGVDSSNDTEAEDNDDLWNQADRSPILEDDDDDEPWI